MSSSKINKDSVSFEVSTTKVVGQLSICRIPSLGIDGEKIYISFRTQGLEIPSEFGGDVQSTNQIVISKERARVLPRFFRESADIIEKWFEEETKNT